MLMGGFSVLAVLLGAGLACLTDQYPRHRPMMERVAGWLFIAGFGLLGADLASAFGPPMR
jgi:hypothetical protein